MVFGENGLFGLNVLYFVLMELSIEYVFVLDYFMRDRIV